MLEVEIKTRIDIEEIKDKLSKLGAKFIREQHQLDTYFYHPCRDFKKNDEALRVRVVADKLDIQRNKLIRKSYLELAEEAL